MSARIWTLRIAVAAIITAAMMWGAVAWAASNQPPPPKPRTVTTVVEKAPPGCEQFVKDSDAFVGVTEDFLGAQNAALDALIAYDTKALDKAVDDLEHLQDRYDEVMDRYSDSRAGCL